MYFEKESNYLDIYTCTYKTLEVCVKIYVILTYM